MSHMNRRQRQRRHLMSHTNRRQHQQRHLMSHMNRRQHQQRHTQSQQIGANVSTYTARLWRGRNVRKSRQQPESPQSLKD